MRGFRRVLLVALLALPSGWLVATPAGAATTFIRCKTLVGTATFKPPLPTKTKAIVTITIKAKYGGCTGAGGSSGLLTYMAKMKTPGNCATLATVGASVTGPESIAWADKTTSSSTAITTKIVNTTGRSSFNGKITKGTLAGKKQFGSFSFASQKNCVQQQDTASVSVRSVSGAVFIS